jgi:hypothetical protein
VVLGFIRIDGAWWPALHGVSEQRLAVVWLLQRIHASAYLASCCLCGSMHMLKNASILQHISVVDHADGLTFFVTHGNSDLVVYVHVRPLSNAVV